MVTKTRDKLIDVARQLFVRKGVDNTTMNDIAEASDKGRRTIYTYFSNKREIYRAVLEKESEQLVSRLRDIINYPMAPVDKLRAFLQEEVRVADTAASDSGSAWMSLVATFSSGREEKLKRLVETKEQELCRKVLDEGCQAGVFNPAQCARMVKLMPLMARGAYHMMRESESSQSAPGRRSIDADVATLVDFVVDAVLVRPTTTRES